MSATYTQAYTVLALPINIALLLFPINVTILMFPINFTVLAFQINVAVLAFQINVAVLAFQINVAVLVFLVYFLVGSTGGSNPVAPQIIICNNPGVAQGLPNPVPQGQYGSPSIVIVPGQGGANNQSKYFVCYFSSVHSV